MFFNNVSKSAADFRFFTWMVVVAQVFGVLAVVMVAVWMGHFQGGFAWHSDSDHQFNLHPLLMILGMVFLYADGILAYRVFRNDRKVYIKVLHASIHCVALVCAVVGLVAVFDAHHSEGYPNLYSLHSWLGLFVVVAFALQWMLGFFAFLTPAVGIVLKQYYMPYHRFWGAALLAVSGATALLGITENAIFKVKPWSGPQGILVNLLGIFIVTFVVLVIYLVTKEDYRRPQAPEEDRVGLTG